MPHRLFMQSWRSKMLDPRTGSLIMLVLSLSTACFCVIHYHCTIKLGILETGLLILCVFLVLWLYFLRRRYDPRLLSLVSTFALLTASSESSGLISIVMLRSKSPLIDDRLAAFDERYLIDTRHIIALLAQHPWLQRFLAVAYATPLVEAFLVIAFFAFTRRMQKTWETVFAFVFTAYFCATISGFFPAAGAFVHYAYPAEMLRGFPNGTGTYFVETFNRFRNQDLQTIDFEQLQGVVCFPSFHACLALIVIYACRNMPRLFPFALLWNLIVIASAIFSGGHYLIDLLAGGLVFLAAILSIGILEQEKSLQASG